MARFGSGQAWRYSGRDCGAAGRRGVIGPLQAMARLDLAELYNRDHRYSDTVALLSVLVDRRSTDRAALLDLGVADVNSGISTTGLDLLRRAHELDPSDQQATITLAIVQLTSGNASDAIATLKPLTQGPSASAVASYQLGLTDLAMSNYEDANTAFEQAKARYPDSTMIEQGIGETLLLGGQPDQAIALFKSLATATRGEWRIMLRWRRRIRWPAISTLRNRRTKRPLPDFQTMPTHTGGLVPCARSSAGIRRR